MSIQSESIQQKISLWGPSPRILAIDPQKPSFIKLALQLSEKGVNSPQFRWASNIEGALSLLRTEPIDCILFVESSRSLNIPENTTRFVQHIQAIRTSNPVTPVVILVDSLSEQLWEKMLHYSCEVFITINCWESSALFGVINHAMRNSFLYKEHSRMTAEKNQQTKLDKNEAEKILAQQRSIVAEIEKISAETPGLKQKNSKTKNRLSGNHPHRENLIIGSFSSELEKQYADILRSYVVMGSENLTEEITKLADLFHEKGLTVRDAFKLHLSQVDLVVSKLGRKSSRQVISRSDLLAMELMMHLCELYRQ